MNEKPKFDWVKFRVHFFCGAILGAALGFSLWAQFSNTSSILPGVLFIGGGVLIAGLVAGCWQDGFWESDWWRWW